jgi:hypothetical protein
VSTRCDRRGWSWIDEVEAGVGQVATFDRRHPCPTRNSSHAASIARGTTTAIPSTVATPAATTTVVMFPVKKPVTSSTRLHQVVALVHGRRRDRITGPA